MFEAAEGTIEIVETWRVQWPCVSNTRSFDSYAELNETSFDDEAEAIALVTTLVQLGVMAVTITKSTKTAVAAAA